MFQEVISKLLLLSVKKTLYDFPGCKTVVQNLREEKKFKEALFKRNEPILPSSLFLVPLQIIVTRPPNKPLFSEISDMDEEILPDSLPFDMNLLKQDIHNFYNPPPPSTVTKPDPKKN